MKAFVVSRLVRAAAFGLAFVLSPMSPAIAAGPFDMVLAAGVACPDFPLRVQSTATPDTREFRDNDGNLVRTIAAGRGAQLTFTNQANGNTLKLMANGSVTRVTFNPDGTQLWVTTGHNVLILFPTDVPAGPSTTLYVGRVVFTVDGAGVFTLLGTSGKATDICAVLSN